MVFSGPAHHRAPDNPSLLLSPIMTHGRAAALLAIVTTIVLACMLPGRTPLAQIWADEGTYLAMAHSLVQDRDLRFDARDRSRLLAGQAEHGEGSATVILQQTAAGNASYSKPVLFPLAAAPLVALFGDAGIVVLNGLLLALALTLAFAYLRTRAPDGHAGLVLVTFVGAGVVIPYVFWRMSDIMQLCLALIGLVLTLSGARADDASRPASRLLRFPGGPLVGAALLGLSVLMRPSNAAIAAIPVLTAALQRRGRRATVLLIATLAPWLLGLALTAAMTGNVNPYRAVRSSFTPTTGYPVGASAPAQAQFDRDPATHHTALKPKAGVDRTLFAAVYFWVGRHSGLLFYFPAAIALGLAALRRPDAPGVASLLGFASAMLFFILWMPWNYFGGHTFIGNRYLLAAYPALLVAPRRLPGVRLLALTWLVAAVSYGSAALSISRTHEIDATSQSHANAGIFRAAPFESTTVDLARHQLYWGDLFVRFVDPFARVRPWHFELTAGVPPAELLVSDWQSPERLRLLVATDAAEAILIATDYRGEWRYPVGASDRQRRDAVVDLTPSPAWRRHRYWWHPTQLYNTSAIRLQLVTPSGEPARAQLRLLGDPERVRESFAYERIAQEVPATVQSDGHSTLRVRVRNTSSQTWHHEGVTPVYCKARLTPRRGPEAGVTWESPAIWLEESVASGAVADLAFEMDWPSRPGAYDLELDLVLARIAWFGARTGKPLVRQKVRVLDPSATTE